MTDIAAKLNKALKTKGSGTATSGTSLRHENEAAILDSAKKLMMKSETGAELLRYAQDLNLQMHVLRGQEGYGFYPEKSTVYITCPAGQQMPTVRAVIELVGAIREGVLESSDTLKRPHHSIGKDRFAVKQMERGKDITMWQTVIVYEIWEATGLLEIIDEFGRMGYSSLIEAHKRDLAEKASN